MKPLDLTVFREAIPAGRIEWRKHVLQKLAERGIPQQAVREVLSGGVTITVSGINCALAGAKNVHKVSTIVTSNSGLHSA